MTDAQASTNRVTINSVLDSSSQLKTVLFFLFCFAALIFGFSARGEYFLTPESGVGYALGIIGGVMMLLLLIYPLRKRFKFLAHVMKLKSWFRIHMLLGVVGPICILYHCNFSLGSTNSNMALVSMCVMVLSGIVGRYFYSKIHLGLYGEKASLQALQSHRLFAVNQLQCDQQDSSASISPQVFQRLMAFESMAMEPRGVVGNLTRALVIGFRTRWTYIVVLWQLRTGAATIVGKNSRQPHTQIRRQAKKNTALFLSLVRKISQLSFFERLFSLWHALHLPIFFMLVVTGFVHIYAVHSY